MSVPPASANDALRMLQQGDPEGALEAGRRALAINPGDARAHLAAGLALRFLQRHGESLAALEQAARLDPRDYGAAFELGIALEFAGRGREALESFRRAVELRAGFLPARHALGIGLHRAGAKAEALPHLAAAAAGAHVPTRWILDHARVLAELSQWDAAGSEYQRAATVAPQDAEAHVELGRFCVGRADLAGAALAFEAACRLEPQRIEWPMYLAQVELLRGRWAQGWRGYRFREQRLAFEAERARAGRPYVVPSLDGLHAGPITLVREQGLGDELFFLRFAPRLRELGVRLAYAGNARLLPLLARTGVFDALRDIEREPPQAAEEVLLTADLPAVVAPLQPFAPPLAIAPRDDIAAQMLRSLEAAGPRPWIALTWRAGTPRALGADALSKEVPLEVLAAALAEVPGTLVALQRSPSAAEIDALAQATGRPVHDFSATAQDLEQALAISKLVDRHVAVSSTNMHLAASAGASADVLVPYPPEWRWRMEGDSPWFPGFRIHRQDRERRWRIRL